MLALFFHVLHKTLEHDKGSFEAFIDHLSVRNVLTFDEKRDEFYRINVNCNVADSVIATDADCFTHEVDWYQYG